MNKLLICAVLVTAGGFVLLKNEKVQPKSPTKLNQLWLNQVSTEELNKTEVAKETKAETEKNEGSEVMTMTELEREYQSLSLKEIDEKLKAIETSDELSGLVTSANERGLNSVESQMFVNMVRSKAVLIKLAIEKSMNEEDIL